MSLGKEEQRFLLRAVLGLPADPATVGGLDWVALNGRALRLGLTGLAWRAVARSGVDASAAGLSSLHRHALHDAAQTALTLSTFVNVSRRLAAWGVKCMALKGIALVAVDGAYVPLRHVSDLDLLVRSRDVEAADAALRASGARAKGRRPTMGGDVDLASVAAQAHATGVANYLDRTDVPIDLHVRPPATVVGGEDGLWSRSTHAQVSGTAVRVPALEDQLVILCDHVLAHHGGVSKLLPRHAADVARLLKLGAARDGSPALGRSSVAESVRLLEEAREVASTTSRVRAGRVVRAFHPRAAALDDFGRGVAHAVHVRLRLISSVGWGALFPTRAYLAASYGVPVDTWWLPVLHLRRLLLDQPLALLGCKRSPPRSQ